MSRPSSTSAGKRNACPCTQNISLLCKFVVGQVIESKQITGANENQLACAQPQFFLKFKITNMVPGVTQFKQFFWTDVVFLLVTAPSLQHIESIQFNSWASFSFEGVFLLGHIKGAQDTSKSFNKVHSGMANKAFCISVTGTFDHLHAGGWGWSKVKGPVPVLQPRRKPCQS